MSAEKKVIKRSNLPTKIPVFSTAVMLFALDYYNCPSWAWGVVITLQSLSIINALIHVFMNDEIDIFEAINPTVDGKSFAEKLKEKMKG